MSALKDSSQNSKKIKTDEKELETEAPISEKDEIKAAERRQNKAANEKKASDKK